MVKAVDKTNPAGAPQPERTGAVPRKAVSKAGPSRRSRPRTAHVDERSRTSRAQEQRPEARDEDEDRPYVQPTSLEAPPARPGYVQRWIRVGMGQNIDEKNWARKQREGWQARDASTVSKKFHVPRIHNGRFTGGIGVEGMLLCEMPEKMAMRRKKFYRDLTQSRTAAVDEDLRRVNAGSVRGGFGPIKKANESVPVREVRQSDKGGNDEEVVL